MAHFDCIGYVQIIQNQVCHFFILDFVTTCEPRNDFADYKNQKLV